MFPWNTALVLCLVKLLPVPVIVFFRSRRDLLLENFALRQQLAVLKRRGPRPRMAVSDRLFWVLLRRFWSPWKHGALPTSGTGTATGDHQSANQRKKFSQVFGQVLENEANEANDSRSVSA